MKNFSLVILLLSSLSLASAQTPKSEEELQQEYLAKARKTSEYKKVYADVKEIQIFISLAKKGTLSKAKVVEEYNDRLSGYMGVKKTFGEVEVRMKDSDALIKMILLKTAGRLALEDAAEVSDK